MSLEEQTVTQTLWRIPSNLKTFVTTPIFTEGNE